MRRTVWCAVCALVLGCSVGCGDAKPTPPMSPPPSGQDKSDPGKVPAPPPLPPRPPVPGAGGK